jgi:hypothetical protein
MIEIRCGDEELIALASEHFTDTGAGLRVAARTPDSLCLESADGYVTMTTCRSDARGRKTHVELETKEYDDQVTLFLRSI